MLGLQYLPAIEASGCDELNVTSVMTGNGAPIGGEVRMGALFFIAEGVGLARRGADKKYLFLLKAQKAAKRKVGRCKILKSMRHKMQYTCTLIFRFCPDSDQDNIPITAFAWLMKMKIYPPFPCSCVHSQITAKASAQTNFPPFLLHPP